MPEGPEIRRAADRVAAVIVGETIEDVYFGLPELQPFARLLESATVTAVETRGKAMLTRFNNGYVLYSHNQLYGRWFTAKRPEMPDTRRSLRVALHSATKSALLYSASDIQVLTDEQLPRHPFLQRLGPDILDENLTPDDVVERLQDRAFRNRSLGALYLDQGFLAGNGNYLRSEILWAARVNPWQKPSQLDAGELRTLAGVTLQLSRRSYKSGGRTVPTRLLAERRAAGERRSGARFFVFGREQAGCPQCPDQIERHKIGSRNIFVCPGCQSTQSTTSS